MGEANNDIVLEVKNLTKDFGSFRAVDNISFSIPRGKITGFLGPNGAGKTTTIQMLLGLTKPSYGKILFFGKNFKTHKMEILQKINYTSAYSRLQNRISVKENLNVFSDLYNVKEPQKTIEKLSYNLEIDEFMHKPFQDLSAGQKTRVNIAKSLLNNPEVLLMDEPTASLDPDISDKILTLIENMRQDRGLSILFTSHDMDEVARLCDQVIFLHKGKIYANDTPKNLTKKFSQTKLLLSFRDHKEIVEKYLSEQSLKSMFLPNNYVEITLNEQQIPKTLFGLSQAGIWISNIEIIQPDLEDVFLHIAREQKIEK